MTTKKNLARSIEIIGVSCIELKRMRADQCDHQDTEQKLIGVPGRDENSDQIQDEEPTVEFEHAWVARVAFQKSAKRVQPYLPGSPPRKR